MKTTLKTILMLLLCSLCTKVFAQEVATVTGKLFSAKSGEAIPYAAAVLTETADSTKRTGVITNFSGEFSFKDLKRTEYLLKLSALGYKTIRMKVAANSGIVNLGTLKMEEDAISLKEVNVTGQQANMKVKKDTLEFNAGAFKTKPNAAVEELLKKLPGVEIDKDGNILVQGQKVSRLTVDGKDFFGTDPKTATKNLPADAIAKVQIVDSKTQEAKATGIDDGQREKVLNLTIKEDKKNGWFGNANVAGGTTDKYNGYLSANHFNKNLQFAVLGMSNNVNNASFNFEDLNSFTGGNIGNIFAPPAGGSFSINVNNGKTTIGGSGVFDNNAIGDVSTHSGGVNYSNTWGKKNTLALSTSYFTYFSSGLGNRLSNIQDLGQGDILRTAEQAVRNSDNQAHRFNLRAEYHPDSLTDIIFRPNVILNYTTNINNRKFSSAFDASGQSNEGTQYLNQKNVTPSLFGEFSILRRMPNNKGSVSLRLNGTQNTFNSDWTNRSYINNYTNGAPIATNTDQQASQENISKTYTINANYVRPVFNKRWNASLGYIYNRSMVDAEQLTYDYNPLTSKYEIIVPAYSNTLDNHNWLQAARVGFIYARTEWTYNFGFGLQQTGLDAALLSSAGVNVGNISKTYYNVLPRLNISFKNKNNQTIQLNYNANVNLPSVNDLQPVQNNNNPLYQRIGNPDLNARKNHRVSVNFNTFSPDNNRYWNGYFLYNLSFDDIGNDVNYVNGVQLVKPVNVDGNYYINTGSYFGMPLKLKGLRMGYGINFNLSHATSFINAEKNITNRYGFGPNASLSYDIDEKLNTGLYVNVSYNKVNNSIPVAVNNKYFNFYNSANISYELFKNFRVDAQLEHNGTAGRTGGFNNNVFLLNAGLEKYFMERRFTLALKGFDILKQNTNIDRLVNNSRIEDVRYNNITRYFYLSVNYKIAKVGASNGRSNPRNTVN
ncbi:TonB-dependent receptor [Pedobacter sp. ASV12]|uniref:TonB-dependent receptor n=1 Tax=Pedobacter sp. ASV12 TaxID=2795120 RepID=UPI0018EB9C4E|nr:TonB-dependent receptor [Pedobacter sp. ASV12]